MKLLFFDTETNGKPKDYRGSYTDVDNWPRVIQLAWLLSDEKGNILRSYNNLIKPDGWEIPKETFWIENGYSTEENAEKGVPIAEAIVPFMEAKHEADGLVAHNIRFDHPIMWAEIIRMGLTPRSGMAKLCTMQSSTGHVGLKLNGRPKWPTLQELHHHLFKKEFDGAHDAMADVKACMDCFFELVDRGILSFPDKVA